MTMPYIRPVQVYSTCQTVQSFRQICVVLQHSSVSIHLSVCQGLYLARTYQSISHMPHSPTIQRNLCTAITLNQCPSVCCLSVCLSAHPSVCLSRTIPSTRTYQSISHATQPNHSKKSAVLQHSSASVCIWSGIKLEVLNCTNGTLCWPKNWMSSLFLSFWQLYELK